MSALPQVSVSRTIAASPATLYAMVSDVSRMGEWSPENTACAWKQGATAPAIGARFTGTNVNGRKKWKTSCVVRVAEPGKEFAFEVAAGPLKIARWSYTFAGSEAGSCTVTETWTDPRNWLARKLGKPVSGVADRATHNRVGMEQTLAALAAAAENETAQP